MTKGEKIRQAASDMGFDDHTDMLEFLDGVGLEVVEKEPSHETRKKLATKQAREAFVHRAAIAFATHPQFDQGLDDKHNLNWRPYLMTPNDAAKEALVLWGAVERALQE